MTISVFNLVASIILIILIAVAAFFLGVTCGVEQGRKQAVKNINEFVSKFAKGTTTDETHATE